MKKIKKNSFKEFPYKKKILITNRINIFNLIILIFLRIFYDKVFFLKIDKHLRHKKILLVLEVLELNWLNYNEYNVQEVQAKKKYKGALYCDRYSVYISEKIWTNSLKIFFLNKNLLATCLNAKIYNNVANIYEVMEMAMILRKNNKVSLFLSNNFFFKTINKKYFFKNLNFINFDIIIIFNNIFSIILSIFVNISKKLVLILLFKKKKNQKYENKLKENKFKVAFFPHKGIYDRNGIKGHFYLDKINSNFNKKNIAHVEWSSSDLNKDSSNYYLRNKIPLFFWEVFSFKKKSIIIVGKFFIFNFKLIYRFLKFSILTEILTSTYQINNAREKIKNNFTKLKYVLVGYDILFTNEISVACKHLGIKTVSVQNRILIPSWAHSMCFDYYFTLGPSSQKIFKKRMSKSINTFCPTEILNRKSVSLKKLKNKNKLKCLVIDYHSIEERKWYENGIIINSWKINYDFYQSILSLSKDHPNISFFIKSKNYVWLKHDYFKYLVKILNKQKNIKILKNHKKWTPEYSIKFTDFAIAKYSSLSDQMLYLNKPVLIFNYDGFPGLLYDFGRKILINNSNQLKNKITLIQKNYHYYNESLQQIRKQLFFSNIKKNQIKNLLINFDRKLNE